LRITGFGSGGEQQLIGDVRERIVRCAKPARRIGPTS
jgi:hypothetical protein